MSTPSQWESSNDRAREIRVILEQSLPGECERLGPAMVEQISRGRAEFAKAPGGNYLDGATALGIAIAAVNLIVALLRLGEELVKMRSSGAAQPEVDAKRRSGIAKADSEAKSLRPDKRKRVIKAVFPDNE